MFSILKRIDWFLLLLISIVVILFSTAMFGSLYLLIKGAFRL